MEGTIYEMVYLLPGPIGRGHSKRGIRKEQEEQR
jgi:hypothetical protein